MSQYIDLAALGRVVLVSLLVGAGLPALFAVGVRMLVPAGGAGQAVPHRNPARTTLAVTCFGIVLAAVAWGVWYIAVGS